MFVLQLLAAETLTPVQHWDSVALVSHAMVSSNFLAVSAYALRLPCVLVGIEVTDAI